MRKFIILTDSCCDLDKNLRNEYDIEYVPMHFTIEEKEYVADLDWKDLSVKDFYSLMQEGKRTKTSQVNLEDYKNRFRDYLSKGYDVLSISCSSGLSSSFGNSLKAKDEILKDFPEAKILCVDSLNSSYGLGSLCIISAKMRNEGKTIEQIYNWLEEYKLNINQECSVDKLSYLRNAGRVSAASAFFGGLLNVKPIIISDASGMNFAVEKVKGRGNSITRIVERTIEKIEEFPYQMLMIGHSDCINDAIKLKEELLNRIDTPIDVNIGYIGPIVGASCGPGTIAVYYYGKKVTINGGE